MNVIQFRDEVLVPVLKEFDDYNFYSQSAVNILMGTVAAESSGSHFAEYVQQIRGPAVSIFQIEPATLKDIEENYLKYRPGLKARIAAYIAESEPLEQQVKWNMALAIIMARLHYRRVPKPLPHHEDVEGLAAYYKEHYNTVYGKSSTEKFIALYDEHVGDAAL